MPRAIRHGLLLLIGVVAFVGVLAWTADRPLDHPTSSDAAAMAVSPRPHGAVGSVALRAPAPCARCDQPRHALAGACSLVSRPATPDGRATPLYARLRVYRL